MSAPGLRSNRPWRAFPAPRSENRALESLRRLLVWLLLGGAIGSLIPLALYVTKAAYVCLLPCAILLVLASAFFSRPRLYWLAIFLLSLQFTLSKNLNDGLSVMQDLKIDYTIQDFTFTLTATDLALFVLLGFWANDRLFGAKPLRLPSVTWLAVGFLALSLLSLPDAASPYLGLVEISELVRYFIIYLFAVNCLGSKEALRVLAFVSVVILVVQGSVTITRFETGYMTPFVFGDTHQHLSQVEQYLAIDRLDEGSAVRGFGTLGSPGSTLRLCLMVIPFALFLCVRNQMFGFPVLFAILTAFGIGGLCFTFTRVFYITTAIQVLLALIIMIRNRTLKHEVVVLLLVLGAGALGAIGPKLYEQFTVREDSVSVRFLQYEATVDMILDHPLLGVGLNNGTSQKKFYAKESYNKYDPNTQFHLEPTHNAYLSLASEVGIPAALLLLIFFLKAAAQAWRHARHNPDPELRLISNALVVVFVGVAVNGLMDPMQETMVNSLLWMCAGIAFTLDRMQQDPMGQRFVS